MRGLVATNPELYAGLAEAASIEAAQLNGKPYTLSALNPELLINLPVNADLASVYTTNPTLFTELMRGRGDGDGDLINIAYLSAGLAKDYNSMSMDARKATMDLIAGYFSRTGWYWSENTLFPTVVTPDAKQRWSAELNTIFFALGGLPEDGKYALARSLDPLKWGTPTPTAENQAILELLKASIRNLWSLAEAFPRSLRLLLPGLRQGCLPPAGRLATPFTQAGNMSPAKRSRQGACFSTESSVAKPPSVWAMPTPCSSVAGNYATRGLLGVGAIQVGLQLTDWSMSPQQKNGAYYDAALLGFGYGFSRLGGVWGSVAADDATAQNFSLTFNRNFSLSGFENAKPWVVAPTEGETGTPYGVVFRMGAPATEAEAGTGGTGQWAVQTGSGTVLVHFPAGSAQAALSALQAQHLTTFVLQVLTESSNTCGCLITRFTPP